MEKTTLFDCQPIPANMLELFKLHFAIIFPKIICLYNNLTLFSPF